MPVFTDYPTTRPTSLNDILGPLQTMQQYKQAQQLNPLQLEKARLELQQAQATNPLELRKLAAETKVSEETANPRIESAKALSSQQQTQAEKAKFDLTTDQSAIAKQILGGIRNLPQVQKAGDDPTAAFKTLDVAKDLMIQSGLPKDSVNAHLKIIKDHVGENAKLLPNIIDNIIGSGLTAQQQQTLQTPQLTTSGGQPALYTPGSGTITPANIQMQNQGAPQGAPQGVTQTQMSLPYPVRQPGDIRPQYAGEETDRANGQTYRNTLSNHRVNLTTSVRNADEVLGAAKKLEQELYFPKGGVAGTMEQRIRNAVASDEYKQLNKDLANVALANMKVLGTGDTVAGINLNQAANGDITVPPDVLISIAKRAKSDMTNIDKQAVASQRFFQKYGDNNMNTFKKLWGDNADSKVFEAMNIYNETNDPEQRKKDLDKLLGTDPKKRKEFQQKYLNIRKLEETGEL